MCACELTLKYLIEYLATCLPSYFYSYCVAGLNAILLLYLLFFFVYFVHFINFKDFFVKCEI